MSLLSVQGLAKSFGGVRAVADASLTVDAGEIVALIGPNGAGKTTTFNMINGQLRPDAGTVLLAGQDVTGLAPRALWQRGVARTFQITETFASMTVAENVQVALLSRAGERGLLGSASMRHRSEALDLIGAVGMAEQADRACAVLAYGDLKRVELALALAGRPRLLLMDEPTAGMAPRERGALMALAALIAREQSAAILFTEHDMDVVFGHAHRIVVMNRGAIIAAGAPQDVRRDPRVRAVYLGAGAVAGH